MKTIALTLVLIAGVAIQAASQGRAESDHLIGQVIVEIDFGGEKPARNYQVEWEEGITVLTALQHCTNIETHPVNEYIFVSDIDGVKNVPYKMAWYYEVNSRKAEMLAYKQVVNIGDTVKWIYKKDVCSGLADCKR